MTQEDKQLLIKDLCARLPYGVILRQYSCIKDYYHNSGETIDIPLNELIHPIFERGFLTIRPYLRPMSSMTEEEENEWNGLNIDPLLGAVGERHTRIEDLMLRTKSQYNPVDWLNAHHFDYRGLIEKGLAIAVTEENNPYKG